jgi:fatty acid desaturase
VEEAGEAVTRGGSDYARLKQRVRAAGLLSKQPAYYVRVIAINLVLVAGCCAVLALFHNPWVQAADAIVLGLVSGQLGFQLHDAGHHQMFERRWKNTLVAFLTADVLLGMSYGWWVSKHNRHHAKPNHVDDDPDINNPAIAYTREQALRRWGPLRLLARYQAFLFFGLICLLAWSMHISSAVFLVRRRSPHRWIEIATLLLHAAVYVGLLWHVLGPWPALMVIVLQKAAGGFYMATVFAPNHKGMPQVDDQSGLDFLRSQVLTSRNIRPNPLADYWFGGLNYQVEHHLFPTMARNNIPRSHRIVQQYCTEIGVPLHETSFLRSYGELLVFLHEVGEPLRRRRPARVLGTGPAGEAGEA